MIIFKLKCDSDHQFEAWFKDAAEFERQSFRKMIECPLCSSGKIETSNAPKDNIIPTIVIDRNQENMMISAQFNEPFDKSKLH